MRRLAGMLVLALGGFAFALPASSRSDNNADIAVIDRALAAAKPSDKFVRFGDVGIKIQDLQIFRARLSGESVASQTTGSAPERLDGVSPHPNADTPNGTAFKWPGGNVYYRFDPTQVSNNTITAAKMQQFRDSVAEWAAFANLHFIENTSGQANYVTVQEKTDGNEGGFSSAVGMAGGEQFVQIGTHSWNRGTICHETGHALGYYHEQQRDDRDSYVVIFFGNIAPADQANFAKLPGGSVAQGAYDFFSVMHYSRKALSKNGQDTIEPFDSQYLSLIGAVVDRTLSKLDRAGMAAVYGNPAVAPSAVVTNTNDSGAGSLRTAIYYAFDLSPTASPAPVSPASTTITFQIPNTDPNFNGQVFTIKPSFVMTAPGDGTTVDATTQTGFSGDTNANGPEVMLDGTTQANYEFAGVFGPGFILRQANCAIKGFVIANYDQQGIRITSDSASGSVGTGNVVSGCYIGTNAAGTTGLGNGNANHNPGIEILGGANHNTIGGLTTSARNLISGSAGYGVAIDGSSTAGNVVVGNYIGLNAAGASALANGFAGVGIFGGAQNNIVGGTTTSARNVISGNIDQGVVIRDSGTNGNVVQGNYIGLNANGTAALPNGLADPANDVFAGGVDLFGGAQLNLIGGDVAGAGNVISGNAGAGVNVSQAGTNGNKIQGNFIGTNSAGSSAIGNGFADPAHGFLFQGVAIFGGAQSTLIGGTSAASANLISGNASQGVFIGDATTSLNVVQGNIIGLTAAGADPLPNGSSGVGMFTGTTSNTVGGISEGARNVISGNSADGVSIGNSGTSANTVQGNFIGLNPAGTSTIANAGAGVAIFSATNNMIGGTTAGARNFICGNNSGGVVISAAGTIGNVVQGNTIGLNFAGLAAGNGNVGVSIFGGAQSNTIGGSATGAGNIVTASGNQGIGVFDETGPTKDTFQNVFSRNSIFANGAKGISLFNGANKLQPAPVLAAGPTLGAVGNLSGTNVSGTLTAAANATFTIEYFASPSGDPSGFGEGQYFLGSASVTTNGAGSVNFSTSLAAAVPAGYVIAATATDSLGNTSEFSAVQTVTTADADGDGVPDNWTNSFFGHALGQAADKSRATDDADGDGMTNLQEFLAGLDPKNANSVLRITSVARSGSSVLVGFPSVTGKIYQLQYRDDLVAGIWNPLVDGIVGTGATLQITDPSGSGLTKRFYRIALRP